MLTLYQLPISHYCEKVRLALAYKGLDYRVVNVNALTRREVRHLQLSPAVLFPTLEDDGRLQEKTGKPVVLSDSSPILRYLDQFYTQGEALFPGDSASQRAIYHQIVELDTALGIPARRLAYTQLLLEVPQALGPLLSGRRRLIWRIPGATALAGQVLGLLLCRRFALHRCEAEGVYEALELYLLSLARRLHQNPWLMGETLTAADLTLAALMRPLKIVPFFRDNALLNVLFSHHQRVISQLGAKPMFSYELLIAQARQRAAPVRRRLQAGMGELPVPPQTWQTIAANDQQNMLRPRLGGYPWQYWTGLRSRKVRQFQVSSTIR